MADSTRANSEASEQINMLQILQLVREDRNTNNYQIPIMRRNQTLPESQGPFLDSISVVRPSRYHQDTPRFGQPVRPKKYVYLSPQSSSSSEKHHDRHDFLTSRNEEPRYNNGFTPLERHFLAKRRQQGSRDRGSLLSRTEMVRTPGAEENRLDSGESPVIKLIATMMEKSDAQNKLLLKTVEKQNDLLLKTVEKQNDLLLKTVEKQNDLLQTMEKQNNLVLEVVKNVLEVVQEIRQQSKQE